MIADRSFNRILVNISCHDKELRPTVDGPAFETSLEQTPDALVFFVISVNKTRYYALEDSGQRNFTRLDEQMNVVGHQTVGDDFVTANRLVFPKN